MKSISVKLPGDLFAKLAFFARQRRTTKSQVIRTALEAYLATNCCDEPSCADLAEDLIGSATGPKDLATNPKYMRGYGR